MSFYRRDGDDLVLQLHVQPGARRDAIVGRHGDALKIALRAQPVDGEANRELVALLARRCGVNRSCVRLLHGAAGRRKRVRIVGAGDSGLQRLLRVVATAAKD